MMPLMFAEPGKENIIRRVGGNPEMRKHLEDMGFVAGESVLVVSAIGGDLIVKVKDSRVAVSREMAGKIMI
ncbi:MAG: ferrous iron transport protein A [Oscillospiraceae bacterium]|nr:ferrous iron transport protein A [Oscillospiraceae bacterium]